MKTRRWLDPRLLIGAALVAVSIASVAFVMSATNRTTEVWAVSNTVVPGDVLGADDVVLTRVQLDVAQSHYHAHDESPIGQVVTRPIAEGELIPVSAVAEEALAERSRIVITVDGPLAEGVARGDVVDVWSAEPLDAGEFATPRVLIDNAVVATVHSNDSLIANATSLQVELLIPVADTAATLHAIASGHALHLVPDSAGGGS